MKKRILNFLVTSILLVNISFCQKIVPVYQEPNHNPVLLNKYLRVIDAQIENGDSSLFHVHATPSAFVFLTDQIAYRTFIFAKRHDAGRARVNAKFAFNTGDVDVISLTDAAVLIKQELGNQEHRNTAHTFGCIR